jgi:SAM-dependent methyltransferase
MKLTFSNHDSYLAAQVATNARKLRKVFACEEEIYAVAEDARQYVRPERGICHGARNGWEVKQLAKLLACDVIGTDIAPTAAKFGLIQLDFHVLPDKWRGYFDFVYSNSLDHSHAPETAVLNWSLSLRSGGRLYIAHCRNSTRAQNLADCYGATLAEYEALVRECCTHVKTLWLGNSTNPDGGTVKDLAIVVGEQNGS